MAEDLTHLSSEELDDILRERVVAKDEYIAAWKEEHAPFVQAYDAAIARELAERQAAAERGEIPPAQAVTPDGIESQEASGGE